MAITSPSVESILALDFGSTQTRVLLFDVVEGQYYFIAAGTAPSTDGAPFFSINESAHHAIRHLEERTGRILLDDNGFLIIPSQLNGSGIDRLALTISSGKTLSVMSMGILTNVSLASIQKLADSTYCEIIDSIDMNDQRPLEEQLDCILRTRPQIILIGGGTNGGASHAVLKNVRLINIACRLLPKGNRPLVMYVGNKALTHKVKEMLDKSTNVIISSNVRPSIEKEELLGAQTDFSEIVGLIRAHQVNGLKELIKISGIPLLPTAYSFGRMVRFFGRLNDPKKKVLGVDIGARSTVFTIGNSDDLWMKVFPYGNGQGILRILDSSRLSDITQWLRMAIPKEIVRDYLYNKSLYPATIPMTEETLAIEQALARHILRLTSQYMADRHFGFGSSYESILASGGVLGQTQNPLQSLLMLLDGLQPIGVTTIVLDQNGLIAALGAVAKINSYAPIQILESGALVNLGTVICPMIKERYSTPVLQARLDYEEGGQEQIEIRYGSISVLPLHYKQNARLSLEPLRKVRINPVHQREIRSFKLVGGLCGAIIDARGRPLVIPTDIGRRRVIMARWAKELGL